MQLRRLSLVLGLLVGCDDVDRTTTDGDVPLDAASLDASTSDAGEDDASASDAGASDADSPDSGPSSPSCAVDNGGCGEHRGCLDVDGVASCQGCDSGYHDDDLANCVPYTCPPSGTDLFEPDDATSPLVVPSDDGQQNSYERTLVQGDVDAFAFTVPANESRVFEWSSDVATDDATAVLHQIVDGVPFEVFSGPFEGAMGVQLDASANARDFVFVIRAGANCHTYSIHEL